jgi:hypothetical protein
MALFAANVYALDIKFAWSVFFEHTTYNTYRLGITFDNVFIRVAAIFVGLAGQSED